MFKTLTFARWSRKAQVSDKALVKAITEMAAGFIDADLVAPLTRSVCHCRAAEKAAARGYWLRQGM
jgi:hypothetical protein